MMKNNLSFLRYCVIERERERAGDRDYCMVLLKVWRFRRIENNDRWERLAFYISDDKTMASIFSLSNSFNSGSLVTNLASIYLHHMTLLNSPL